MKRCNDCGGYMEEREAFTPEGIRYSYFKCRECGEEIVDMKQLHAVAEKYRLLKLYHAKITQWGQSLGLRIPKELAAKYHFKRNEKVTIIPEKGGIKVIPAGTGDGK
jgi:predicted RNA-binding Zn-ribbon protein involved in translation (DUF1610 family)